MGSDSSGYLPLLRPVKIAAIDNGAAHGIAMAAHELCERMDHDVGAMLDRLAQIGRGQRVVDNERNAGALGNFCNRRNVGDAPARIGDGFNEDRLGLGRQGLLDRIHVFRIGPHHMPAEGFEGMVELVDRPAIELAHRHEFIAGLHDGVEHQHLRRMARGQRQGRRAAFQCRDLGFKNALRRVHDAGVDVAEGPQREQIRGVFHVVENIGRGLVDGRDPGARGGIGCRAGVNG